METLKGSWPWPWPWIWSYCIPSCITHRSLPPCQISLRSKKLSVDGRTYGRTHRRTFETGFIRSTLSNCPPKIRVAKKKLSGQQSMKAVRKEKVKLRGGEVRRICKPWVKERGIYGWAEWWIKIERSDGWRNSWVWWTRYSQGRMFLYLFLLIFASFRPSLRGRFSASCFCNLCTPYSTSSSSSTLTPSSSPRAAAAAAARGGDK